jgi:hypothetical protein
MRCSEVTKGQEIPKERRATKAFHGTNYDYEGFVLPRGAHGNMHYDISGKQDTYFLPADGSPEQTDKNEQSAWNWSRLSYVPEGTVEGRQRVHVTRPIGVQHMDRNLDGVLPPRDEHLKAQAAVAPAQEILDTRWAPPATPGTHVEQTLPHINWNQFGGAPNWRTHVAGNDQEAPQTFDQMSPQDVQWERARKGNARRWGQSEEQAASKKSLPQQELPGQGELFNGSLYRTPEPVEEDTPAVAAWRGTAY